MRNSENLLYHSFDNAEKDMRHPSPYVRKLQRELFYMWVYLAQEELLDDALDYMEEHRNKPTPFEFCS